MQPVIADLFDGDRAALNASALAAGYAKLYGLDPALAELPRVQRSAVIPRERRCCSAPSRIWTTTP